MLFREPCWQVRIHCVRQLGANQVRLGTNQVTELPGQVVGLRHWSNQQVGVRQVREVHFENVLRRVQDRLDGIRGVHGDDLRTKEDGRRLRGIYGPTIGTQVASHAAMNTRTRPAGKPRDRDANHAGPSRGRGVIRVGTASWSDPGSSPTGTPPTCRPATGCRGTPSTSTWSRSTRASTRSRARR